MKKWQQYSEKGLQPTILCKLNFDQQVYVTRKGDKRRRRKTSHPRMYHQVRNRM